MVPLTPTHRAARAGAAVGGRAVTGWRRSCFGLSRSFWLTFACLALTGATDTVSMVIRNIVRQLETPDRLRGRMTGVNMVFFMGGPQLGEFEAGARRELARRDVLGRQRRHRVPDRDRLGGGDDAGAADDIGGKGQREMQNAKCRMQLCI